MNPPLKTDRAHRIRWMFCAVALLTGISGAAFAQASPSIHITSYTIDLTLNPAQHSLVAETLVTFTPRNPQTTVSFELNPALQVSSVTSTNGQSLKVARPSDSNALEVTTPSPLSPDVPVVWKFSYTGNFPSKASDRSHTENAAATPVPAQLAKISAPVSYLLRGSHWFPVTPDSHDRYTATIHVQVPAGEIALGSGPVGLPHSNGDGSTTFTLNWAHPGFPGTILAGKFREFDVPTSGTPGTGPSVRLYRIGAASDSKNSSASPDTAAYVAAASQIYGDLVAQFGPPPSHRLDIVELPDGAPLTASSPGVAAIATAGMGGENALRLLANTIAHQWWGNAVSPATQSDAWITNGMCRTAELIYLEHHSGQAALQHALLNVSASALAYNTPISGIGQLAPSSAEFEALTYDKGAMVLRMLQWQIGDAAFRKMLRAILAEPSHTISTVQLRHLAQTVSGQNLTHFFDQWVNGTGAPALEDHWILYRLTGDRGYLTTGEIHEDLDLFDMPVDIQIKTKDKTIHRRVRVSGPETHFSITTAAIPETISIDPDRRLLRNSPAMQVRVHVLRGGQMAASLNFTGAIHEYEQALAINKISSLVQFRLGQAYLHKHDNQAAEHAFRAALNGDGIPKWTAVWSELELGKIFDAAGQRERAVNQYRKALATGDNSGGALDLARGYIEHAYQPDQRITK